MEQTDRDTIRRLATELRTLADRPEEKQKIEGWKKINSLQAHHPMLWITEIPWGELENKVPALTPTCEDPSLRWLECCFLQTLFTAKHLPCDQVILPVYHVQHQLQGQVDYGVNTQEQQISQGETSIVSHHYEPVIKDFDDIEKIKMPDFQYDEEATLKNKAFFDELFGDILDVELAGPRQHFFNGWDCVVRWTGVSEALMDLIVRPDYVHALMRRLTDSFLARMARFEELNLLSNPHPLQRVGSGAAGFTDELPQPNHDPAHIRPIDQWGGATPQIFAEVSPDMHEEFALKYEIEVMEKCGLNYYGCCEPLHNKMALMAKVPRLRKISVSSWCDVAKTARGAQQKYVFSHKPSPAILAEDRFNVERAEQDLRERLEQSGDMPCEFIMKDISTVRGDIDRVIAWCEMAHRVTREG